MKELTKFKGSKEYKKIGGFLQSNIRAGSRGNETLQGGV